jgi:hypothetical protein
MLAEDAALGAHPFIFDDGPELPEEPGLHAEAGDEALEEMYAKGRETVSLGQRRRGEAGEKIQEEQEARQSFGGAGSAFQ